MKLPLREVLNGTLRRFSSARREGEWLTSLRGCLTPFQSPLLWSHSEDDCGAEFAALDWLAVNSPQTGQGMRVLQACGGGDTAVALLSRADVTSVHCVESHPAQLHLAQLKLAVGVSELSETEALALLGMESPAWERRYPSPEIGGKGIEAANGAKRVELFDCAVAAELPAESAKFWNSRRDSDIRFGVGRSSRQQQVALSRLVCLMEAGISPQDLLRGLSEGGSSCFSGIGQALSALNSSLQPEASSQAMGFIRKEASADEQYELMQRLVELHEARVEWEAEALTGMRAQGEGSGSNADGSFSVKGGGQGQGGLAGNLWATLSLLNEYAGVLSGEESGLPLWLQGPSRVLLKERRRASTIPDAASHAEPLLLTRSSPSLVEAAQQLRADPKENVCSGFDLISTSLSLDRLGERAFGEHIGYLRHCLAPGGVILARRTTGGLGFAMPGHLIMTLELGKAVSEAEKHPLFFGREGLVTAGVEDGM
ncbi:unnamed protein product [Choristocarpus tenellus]